MVELAKQAKLVGNFIRQRREALGLSQRALGLLFSPPVTTQFISNVERGVTPLPPIHVPILTRALLVSEDEIMGLLEREYVLKLSGRLGKVEGNGHAGANGNGASLANATLVTAPNDYDFMRRLYDAYRQADPKTRQAFGTVCESLLSMPKAPTSGTEGQPPGE